MKFSWSVDAVWINGFLKSFEEAIINIDIFFRGNKRSAP